MAQLSNVLSSILTPSDSTAQPGPTTPQNTSSSPTSSMSLTLKLSTLERLWIGWNWSVQLEDCLFLLTNSLVDLLAISLNFNSPLTLRTAYTLGKSLWTLPKFSNQSSSSPAMTKKTQIRLRMNPLRSPRSERESKSTLCSWDKWDSDAYGIEPCAACATVKDTGTLTSLL